MTRRYCYSCDIVHVCNARKVWICPEDEQPLDLEMIEKWAANSIRLPFEFTRIKNEIEGRRREF